MRAVPAGPRAWAEEVGVTIFEVSEEAEGVRRHRSRETEDPG